MKYFKSLPKILYPIKYNTFEDTAAGKELVEYSATIDLNVRYSIFANAFNNPFFTYDYTIKDGDTPHLIAHLYYGDMYYDWVVMLSGQLFDWLHDFPMTSEQLDDYIQDKYDISFVESLSTIHHYEDGNGFIHDLESWNLIPEPKRAVSIYDYEFEQNEDKRKIKLISKQYLPQILLEYEVLVKTINNNREISKV